MTALFSKIKHFSMKIPVSLLLGTFLGFFLWGYVPGLSGMGLGLATGYLFLLAMKARPEVFFASCVVSLGLVCDVKHAPIALMSYAVYVFLPFFFLNIYKEITRKRPEIVEIFSVFDCLTPLFFLITFLMAWVWPSFLPLKGMPSWVLFCGPGILSLWAGTLLISMIQAISKRFSYPLPKKSFVLTTFDYVWLAVYETAWIFSEGYPPNLLFVAFLPFVIRGLLWLKEELHALKYKERTQFFVLMLCGVLLVPACGLALYALFEPWLDMFFKKGKRKVHNGNR